MVATSSTRHAFLRVAGCTPRCALLRGTRTTACGFRACALNHVHSIAIEGISNTGWVVLPCRIGGIGSHGEPWNSPLQYEEHLLSTNNVTIRGQFTLDKSTQYPRPPGSVLCVCWLERPCVPRGTMHVLDSRQTHLAQHGHHYCTHHTPARFAGCYFSGGDDNVAIKNDTANVLIEDCVFGNGHGASIGSVPDTNGV